MRVNILIRDADAEDRSNVALWALSHYQTHPTHEMVDHRILDLDEADEAGCTTLRLTLRKRA
jgi:hypothetical protein